MTDVKRSTNSKSTINCWSMSAPTFSCCCVCKANEIDLLYTNWNSKTLENLHLKCARLLRLLRGADSSSSSSTRSRQLLNCMCKTFQNQKHFLEFPESQKRLGKSSTFEDFPVGVVILVLICRRFCTKVSIITAINSKSSLTLLHL